MQHSNSKSNCIVYSTCTVRQTVLLRDCTASYEIMLCNLPVVRWCRNLWPCVTTSCLPENHHEMKCWQTETKPLQHGPECLPKPSHIIWYHRFCLTDVFLFKSRLWQVLAPPQKKHKQTWGVTTFYRLYALNHPNHKVKALKIQEHRQ